MKLWKVSVHSGDALSGRVCLRVFAVMAKDQMGAQVLGAGYAAGEFHSGEVFLSVDTDVVTCPIVKTIRVMRDPTPDERDSIRQFRARLSRPPARTKSRRT